MKKEEDFRDRLEPFAEIYKNMFNDIRTRLEAMTEEELKQILEDAKEPSQTNCGWTTFEVAKIVRDIGRHVVGFESVPQAIKATESPSVAEAEGGLS